MDFKSFMTSVEQTLSRFHDISELKEWIQNYARSLPEEAREDFLKQLQETEQRSHKEKLDEIIAWCKKLENEEIVLSCYSHEEYDPEYWTWDPDWVTEYEDPAGIGPQLKKYYAEAEQAVYDRDYDSASLMYWNLGTLTVTAEDETGMDPVELGIEEMVSESLVSLDLKKIASLTLYSTYQAYELPERVPKLYGFFSWRMFQDIGIEDMLSAGRETLQGVEDFLDAWISYLREQDDSYTSRLLIEAITYRGGDEDLLEEAKREPNHYPKLYIRMLERLFEKENWDRLQKEGMEALSRMKRKIEMRDRAARLAAAGAARCRDAAKEMEALCEAFCSKPTAANYFRVITSPGAGKETENEKTARMLQTAEELQAALQAGEKPQEYGLWNRHERKETDSYRQTDTDRMGICFLSGDYREILRECRKTKEHLGWSGRFINAGVPMLLLFLYEEDDIEKFGKAMRSIVSDIQGFIGYQAEFGEADFEERFLRWRELVKIPAEEKKKILKYVTETIDQRVEAIVGGSHRKSYWKAAKLGAALGEVEESQGKMNGKYLRIQGYLKQFPRHRAFKEEIGAYNM